MKKKSYSGVSASHLKLNREYYKRKDVNSTAKASHALLLLYGKHLSCINNQTMLHVFSKKWYFAQVCIGFFGVFFCLVRALKKNMVTNDLELPQTVLNCSTSGNLSVRLVLSLFDGTFNSIRDCLNIEGRFLPIFFSLCALLLTSIHLT